MSGLSLGKRVPNLKSVALTILELLAFNGKNSGGHVTLATPPFGKFFGVMSGLSLGTRVSNLKFVALTVLQLSAFNSHFKLVWLTGPLRAHTQTDRHTSNEHIYYLRHSLRSLGGVVTRWRSQSHRTSNA